MGYPPQIVQYAPKTLLKVITAHQDDPSLWPITKRPTKLQKSKISEKNLYYQRWGTMRVGWGMGCWKAPQLKNFSVAIAT